MDGNSPLREAVERWQLARATLAHFEALHLTLLLVSHESDVPLHPPVLPDAVLEAWRDAENEAHAAYAQLLDILTQHTASEGQLVD